MTGSKNTEQPKSPDSETMPVDQTVDRPSTSPFRAEEESDLRPDTISSTSLDSIPDLGNKTTSQAQSDKSELNQAVDDVDEDKTGRYNFEHQM